jgi:hypothetical protein
MVINPIVETYELSRLFGRAGHQGFSCSLSTKLNGCKETLSGLINPGLHYRIQRIDDVGRGSVSIQGGITFKSPNLSRALKDSDEIVCFVATIGGAIEGEISRLMAEKHLSKAYILDAMGSVAVENMVEQFHQRQKTKFAAHSKATTLRFSPGYCDWPVTDQEKLFTLFDSESTGVELLDSCLMQPRKSISGVFGLFHTHIPRVSPPYNACRACEKTDCIARRT